jgi:diguanylate cyclase (GGDEF)-like protein/PAS domain S-box-containing protein
MTEQSPLQEQLRVSEARYWQLLNHLPLGFALHEILSDDQGQPHDYRFLEINAAFEQITGLCAADLIGKTVRQALPNAEMYWIEIYGRVALTGESVHFENYTRELDKYFDVVAYSPRRGQFACLFNDITEHKRIEKTLYLSRLTLDHMADAVFWIESTGQIIDVNETACRILGYTRKELLALSVPDVEPDFPLSRWPKHWQELQRAGTLCFETRHKTKIGRVFPVEVQVNFLTLEGRAYNLSIARDITVRKRMEEELRRLATLDPLTSLFNRRYFFTLAQQEYERLRQHRGYMALIIADLDHFKVINDRHGYLIGDQVLQAVADTVQRTLRPVDILGRYSGEAFAMVLPETDIATARALAERLRTAIADQAIATKHGSLSLTMSFGVAAMSDDNPMSLEQLLDHADQMLYQAKQAGRNRVVVWGEATTHPSPEQGGSVQLS